MLATGPDSLSRCSWCIGDDLSLRFQAGLSWLTILRKRPAFREAFSHFDIDTLAGWDLKRRGWTYVGPTTVYAFMQARGLVDDHRTGCWRRPAVESARAAFTRP